jgi:hypothetical protein
MFKQIRQDALPTGTLNQTLTIPWYDPSYTTNPTSAGTMPALELGEKWTDFATGNEFAMIYLDLVTSEGGPVTFSGGTLVCFSLPGTDTIAGTTSTLDTVTLVTGALVVNAEVGNYIFFQDLGVSRLIKANTATTVSVSLKTSLVGNNQFDADVLPGIPANGTNVSIIRPWHCSLNSDTTSPTGVLINDTVTGSRTIVQISGPLAFVLGNNSATAVAAGIPAGTGAAGIVDGIAPALNMSGKYIIPWAAYDNVNLLIPCQIALE